MKRTNHGPQSVLSRYRGNAVFGTSLEVFPHDSTVRWSGRQLTFLTFHGLPVIDVFDPDRSRTASDFIDNPPRRAPC